MSPNSTNSEGRNRMNRMGVPIEGSDGIMAGMAAIAGEPIRAKKKVKAGS
jgi:hypothetical protein